MSDIDSPRSWLIDRPLSGPALPRGRTGRLWGWLIGFNTAGEQREVLIAAAPVSGERALEVGYGPGVLLAMLARTGAEISGVDPAEPMAGMARRRLARAGVDASRIGVGTAERTGFPDASFDLVVSVNNVPMWSDLAAGFGELRRVLAPGGRLVVAWHGGRQPYRFARRLTLPEEVLDRILTAQRESFGNGERQTLDRVEVFTALKQ